MMLSPHDDPQTAQDYRWADYEEELDLAAEKAVEEARKAFGQLRSILIQSPDVVGHYKSEIGDLANDFLEIAAQAPRIHP